MKRIALACLALACLPGLAAAADLKLPPLKAAPAATLASLDQGWRGFYAAADIYGSGTDVGVIDLGSSSTSASFFGTSVGYESFNGAMLLGVEASVGYDMGAGASVGAASFSDKAFWRAGVRLGGSLAGALSVTGVPPVSNPLPNVLLNGIPFVAVGACGHHGVTGRCAGGGMEWIVPASRWTVAAEYINARYDQSAVPTQEIKTEQIGRLSLAYHFGN